jgi:glucuronosyltransferase
MVDACFAHAEMKALFDDPNTKFDAVIVVPFFGNEAGYYLAHRFKAPLILYFTGQVSIAWVDDAIGQPHNTAYLPTAILPFTSEMTFFQRVINTFGNFVFHKILRNTYILGTDHKILKKHFPIDDIPDLVELEKNASLSMSFSHPLIMDGWRPYVPNHVNLGMMNCKAVEKLPPDNKIGQFLDNAKEGVVYVSFGSVISASLMSEEKRQSFLSAFKKLKQKVLWKWETETMDGKPDNVILSKWLPQQEVLAHPNVKLFITHGGQSSFQETLCHKKPVVSLTLDSFVMIQFKGSQHTPKHSFNKANF